MEKIENNNNSIKGFRDLKVYQNLYKAMLVVMKEIILTLPKEEQFDLASQMRRASKAAPALIAEGFAKRYQKKNWQKYINDTIGESNEMIHHLSVCIGVYSKHVDVTKCNDLIDNYDICCKQLTNLGKTWQNFHDKNEQ
jgi:four helix bundle protein